MDLIKKVETTEFSQRLRGYDIDEVDAFHAELVRDIAQLNRQIAETTARREEESERAPSPRRPPERPVSEGRLHDPDGAIQRMLAVAQRTADEAVSEARDDAERLVAEAEAHALRVTTEADARAAKVNSEADQQRRLIVTEAAAEARRIAEATRAELLTEIAELEVTRDALVADLDVLDSHVDDERSRIIAAMARMQEVLDDPAAFRASEPPPLHATPTPGVDVLDESPAVDDEWDAGDTVADGDDWDAGGSSVTDDEPETNPTPGLAAIDLVHDDTDDTDAAPEVEDEVEAEHDVDWVGGGLATQTDDSWSDVDWDEDDDLDDVVPGSSVFDDDGPGASVTDLASARNEVLRPADEPLPSPEPVASPYPDEVPDNSPRLLWDDETETSDGPPTEAVLIDDLLAVDNPDNDRFLNELRKATEDEFGADESDAAIAAFFDQDEDESPTKRRGRRT